VASAGAFALGDLREAERGFSRALSLADRLSDELMLARCANNLGNVAYYLGRHSAALSYYRLAASRFEKAGFDYGVAETLINTGLVWRDLQNLRESRDAAERALEIAERDNTWRLAAQALAMRGEAMALMGDLPLGRAQVERALAAARQREDRLAEVEALRILCNLERVGGHLSESERLGRAALDLATALSNPWSVAEAQRDLGETLATAGRGPEAADCWNEAAALFQQLGAISRADQMREKATSIPSR
jgi:tetratricopeptide (TPR) repeat protein